MAYTVYVDDNFHFMDESKRYKLGEYERAEDAVKAAQRIVDEFLVSRYAIGMTADELYQNYLSFGQDPFIVPASEDPPFSAWDYAKRQSARICSGFFLDVFLPLQKNDGFSFEEETYRHLKSLFEASRKPRGDAPARNQSAPAIVEKAAKLEVSVMHNSIYFGEDFSIDFQRTLRLPDDGKTYYLPPDLGYFPVYRVSDYAGKVPSSWNRRGGVFIPMYQREALWINFRGNRWKPYAVKAAVGKINAVTGEPWNQTLSDEKQDYMVCPPQRWLDGIKTGYSATRQFVAMPLGMNYSVEEQLSGNGQFGGIQIIVFEPKRGKFVQQQQPQSYDEPATLKSIIPGGGFEMGVAAGGKVKQKIYEDEYGIETWDEDNFGRVYVHIINSMAFREITGEEPPPTPVSTKTYAENGLPWFDVYDEDKKGVPVREKLYTIKPVKLIDKMNGFSTQQDDEPIEIEPEKIKTLEDGQKRVEDGSW